MSSSSNGPPETTLSETDMQIQKYRNITITFIKQYKKDLVSIFLQHSRDADDEDRVGVVGINLLGFDETSKVDVAYLPVRILADETRTRVLERIKENDVNDQMRQFQIRTNN